MKKSDMKVVDIAPLSFETNKYIRPIRIKGGKTRYLNLKELFAPSKDVPFGIIAANAFAPEMLMGVLDAAWEMNSPVIIEPAESQVGYALPGKDYQEKLSRYADMLHDAVSERARKYGRMVPIGLHLDHLQKDPNLAYAARDNGWTSVELDFSNQPTQDRAEAVELNIRQCVPIINDLHPVGMAIENEEGEIGSVATREAQSVEDLEREITKAKHAVRLAEGTHPEATAPFIGSSHGEFKKEPVIFYGRIGEIKKALDDAGFYDTWIALHGGTGQTNDGFQEAIMNGARKFNYASRFWTIYADNLKKDKAGAAILDEMDKVARETKGKSGRYVCVDIVDRLYKEVSPDTFANARKETYDHVCDLMENAFLSKGKADLYALPIR